MNASQEFILPRFVAFEGVDGTGKTSFFNSLANYYKTFAADLPLYADSFPGSLTGTLGEWVYRVHHNKTIDGPAPENIAPPALQLLHVAAHIDAILNHIGPILTANGNVILDRYWWSTFAYSRSYVTKKQALALVNVERAFLDKLPHPTIIYLTRQTSLKSDEIDQIMYHKIDTYYREVIELERESGTRVFELSNDSSLLNTWKQLLRVLDLPFHKM